MTLTDPLKRLDSDCVSLTFEFLSPKDVLQCLRVCRQWRNNTNSWIERVGFRTHCCPILFDGEDVDRVAYYKRHAQQDVNLAMGQPTSIRRLGRCMEEPQLAGQYQVWIGDNYSELYLERRSLSSSSQYCGDNSGDVDGGYKSIKLLSPLSKSMGSYHLNADGLLLPRFCHKTIIYDLSETGHGDNPHDQQLESKHEVSHWETPARWFNLGHNSALLGASHVYSVHNTGQELAAHDFRSGKLAYHIRYPVTDEYAPGEWPGENEKSFNFPRLLGDPKLITLRDGREIVLQTQSLKPDASTTVINVIDGATGARMQRLRCGGRGLTLNVEVLPPRCRKGAVVYLFRIIRTVRTQKRQYRDPHAPLLVFAQTFAYTERLGRASECVFQSIGFDSFILPEGIETIALHPTSCVGFTIPNPQTGSPLGVFRLSQSFDTRLEVEIKNLTKELHLENFEGAPDRYFSITGLRDLENLMKPGDKGQLFLRSLTDGRLMVLTLPSAWERMVSALRGMDVKIMDFE